LDISFFQYRLRGEDKAEKTSSGDQVEYIHHFKPQGPEGFEGHKISKVSRPKQLILINYYKTKKYLILKLHLKYVLIKNLKYLN